MPNKWEENNWNWELEKIGRVEDRKVERELSSEFGIKKLVMKKKKNKEDW